MEKNLYIDASHPNETRVVLKSGDNIEDYEYEGLKNNLIKNNPLSIIVNGVDFLDGTAHMTTGRKIAVRFMRNTAPEDTDYFYDNRKSGDFLIFAAKHSFNREEYTASLSCLKISEGDVE